MSVCWSMGLIMGICGHSIPAPLILKTKVNFCLIALLQAKRQLPFTYRYTPHTFLLAIANTNAYTRIIDWRLASITAENQYKRRGI